MKLRPILSRTVPVVAVGSRSKRGTNSKESTVPYLLAALGVAAAAVLSAAALPDLRPTRFNAVAPQRRASYCPNPDGPEV